MAKLLDFRNRCILVNLGVAGGEYPVYFIHTVGYKDVPSGKHITAGDAGYQIGCGSLGCGHG